MKNVKIALITMSSMYGRQLNDAVITMYVDALKNYSEEQILWALEQLRNDSKIRTMPIIADVLAKLNPKATDRDEGVVIANKLFSLVEKRGRGWQEGVYSNGEAHYEGNKQYFADWTSACKAEVGELGFQVIRMMGGWLSVCEAFNLSDHSIVKAQVRDLTETIMRKAKAGTLETPTALPEAVNNQKIGSMVKELSAKKTLE